MARHRIQLLTTGLAVLVLIVGCKEAPAPPTPTANNSGAAEPAAVASPLPAPTRAASPWTPGELQVHLLDVGHGDAQLIVSPTGQAMLIDCGRPEYAEKVASYLSDVLGSATVDYVLISHYHVDHIGGFVPLVQEYGLTIRKAVLDRGGGPDECRDSAYLPYYECLTNARHGLTRQRVRPGDQIDLGPHLDIRVLAVGDIDTRTNAGVTVVSENDNSIALWLRFGLFDYFTAGDLSGEASTAYADIESAVIPLLRGRADVMKANHHCQTANNHPEFIAALDPQVILVSGDNSVVRWHPLLRLERQCPVYITGSDIPAHNGYGDIIVRSHDGRSFGVEGDRYACR